MCDEIDAEAETDQFKQRVEADNRGVLLSPRQIHRVNQGGGGDAGEGVRGEAARLLHG